MRMNAKIYGITFLVEKKFATKTTYPILLSSLKFLLIIKLGLNNPSNLGNQIIKLLINKC